MTISFRSFNAFGRPSKKQLFVRDMYKWAPEGFYLWVSHRDKRPGMVRLMENKVYVHEVAAKLIEEKRQELKDGTSRKDVMSLLGSSALPS